MPVLEVNVPELVQLPVSVMVPLVVCKVPELVMLPPTLSVPVLTLTVEPDGIVRLAPHAEETRNIAARVSAQERMMEKILILVRCQLIRAGSKGLPPHPLGGQAPLRRPDLSSGLSTPQTRGNRFPRTPIERSALNKIKNRRALVGINININSKRKHVSK